MWWEESEQGSFFRLTQVFLTRSETEASCVEAVGLGRDGGRLLPFLLFLLSNHTAGALSAGTSICTTRRAGLQSHDTIGSPEGVLKISTCE